MEAQANIKEAVKLLRIYNGGIRHDIWGLAGSSKASCRAHVMSVLSGVKTPQAKSGINAIRAAFYEALNITGECEAEREDNFKAACKLVELPSQAAA